MSALFRGEATEKHRNRLSGDVAIAVPVAWQSIGFLIFGGVAAGMLFLSLASYSRVETVTGTITPDAGVATIAATRPGVIAALAGRDRPRRRCCSPRWAKNPLDVTGGGGDV